MWVRWPLQPLQPLQQTQIQPPFGQSVDSLCHPWFATTNLSYRLPILKLPLPPCAVLLVVMTFMKLPKSLWSDEVINQKRHHGPSWTHFFSKVRVVQSFECTAGSKDTWIILMCGIYVGHQSAETSETKMSAACARESIDSIRTMNTGILRILTALRIRSSADRGISCFDIRYRDISWQNYFATR